MGKVKDKDIYPRFEFRLSHEEKEWLNKELKLLKEKFSEDGYPPITRNTLLVAALRYGFRYLKGQSRTKARTE